MRDYRGLFCFVLAIFVLALTCIFAFGFFIPQLLSVLSVLPPLSEVFSVPGRIEGLLIVLLMCFLVFCFDCSRK